jgi:hypothetical protein
MRYFTERWSLFLWALIAFFALGARLYRLTEIPLTLWADEAWFEVRGREVLNGEAVWPRVDPVFSSGNSPFQTYSTALVQAFGWPVAYSSRVVSALSGFLSVALAFPFLRALFAFAHWPETRRTVAALAGTASLATTFALLLYSRDGTQNVSCTLFTLLVMWGLHKTFQTPSPRAAHLTGLALALALTTYEAAYALPLIIICVALAYALATSQWRLAIFQTMRIALTAALLLSPLLVFYFFHPEVVLNRVQEAQSGNVVNPAMGLMRVWLGVVWEGDALIGQNLVGRPLLDLFNSTLLLFGLVAVGRVWRTSGAQLLLITVLIMPLPSAITQNPPAFTRMLPMLPALAGLVGWGVGTLWGWSTTHRWHIQIGMALLLALGFAFSGGNMLTDYFGRWANDPRLFDARQVGARLLAEQALTATGEGDVFVTPRSQPLVYYTYQTAFMDTPVQTLDPTSNCLPLAHLRPTPTTYAITLAFDEISLPVLKAAYPTAREWPPVLHPQGYAYGLSLQVPANTPAPAPAHLTSVQFENDLRLVGFDSSLPTSVQPGAIIEVRLHWEAAGPIVTPLTSFLHLGRGRESNPMAAQSDGPLCSSFPPERWQAGYRYIEVRQLTLVAEAPNGEYDVRVGVYDSNTQLRLNILEAAVPHEDNRAILTTFRIEP